MRITARYLSLLVFFMFVQAVVAQGPARVYHDPVTQVRIGRPLILEARLEGNLDQYRVLEVRVYYRTPQNESYVYEEMLLTGDRWTAEIPAADITTDGLEYYIEYTFESQPAVTSPPQSADTNPYIVNVAGGQTVGESPVIILSPEPNTIQRSSEVLIAMSFNRSAMKFDPTKVIVRLDGKNITSKGNLSAEVFTAVVDNLEQGRHRVDVVLNDPKGPKLLDTWFFTVYSKAVEQKYLDKNLHGQVSVSGRTQHYSGVEQNIMRETATMRGNLGNVDFSGYVRLTSEEQSTLQPQHRFQAQVGTSWLNLRVGDINPRYNPLFLWGRRVRGTEIRVGTPSKSFSVIGLYGRTVRPQEGREILSGGTPVDTTFGKYRRMVGAARFVFGPPASYQIGFTAMKVVDDKTSIDYGENPKDNVATGFDIEVFADRRRITLTGEAALSLYNRNTNVDVLDDTEDFKDIIWINPHFVPLPGDTSTAITDILGSVIDKALTYKGALRLRYFANDIQVGYKLINSGYNSLMLPTLKRDQKGYFVSDRIRLFRSRFYLNGKYETYEDNVNGIGDITTTNSSYQGGLSMYTRPGLPDLSLTYRHHEHSNDASDTTYIFGADTTFIQRSQDDASNYITFNFFQTMPIEVMDFATFNEFNGSVIVSDLTNEVDTLGTADQLTFSGSLKSRYDYPFETLLRFSNSNQTALNSMTDLTYTTFTFRGDYFFFNRDLDVYFGPRFTFGSGVNRISPYSPEQLLSLAGADPTDPALQPDIQLQRHTTPKEQAVDFTKVDWIAGAEYKVKANHYVSAYVSMTTYSDKSKNVYWNGAEFPSDQEEIENISDDGTVYSTTQAGAGIERNDLLAMFTYSYKF